MVDEYGLFHLSRLEAEPKLKELAEAFRTRQEALETKGNAFKQAHKAISAFEAQMVKADYDMDNALRDLYFSKLAACGNNKKDPAILKWFPDGLTALVRCGFEEEAGKVAALIGILAETPDDPVVVKVLPNLKAMLDVYLKSVASLRSAVTAAGNMWELLEAEKVNWVVAYSKSYADVLAFHQGNKKATDTFFKKASKPKKSDGGEDAKKETPKT